MRVDPLYVPNLVGSLDSVAATEQTLSQELSSGSRVTALSDDPGAAADNVVLTAQIAQDDTFTQTGSDHRKPSSGGRLGARLGGQSAQRGNHSRDRGQ